MWRGAAVEGEALMATAINIEVNVNESGVVNSVNNQTAAWQSGAAKWGAAVDNFKNNLIAYNAVVDEGGKRLATWDAAMEKAKAEGASFAQQLEAASQELVNFGAKAEQAGEKVEYSMTRARASFAGLERELGVGSGLGRALTTFVAQSETLGPIFATAFNVVAAVAFAEVIGQLTTKMVELYTATFIWTEAMKAAYAGQLTANNAVQNAVQRTKELEAEHFTNTHSGVENASRDIDTLAAKYQSLNTQLENLNQRRAKDLGLSDQTEKVVTSSGRSGVQFQVVPTQAARQAQDDLQAVDRDLAVVKAQLGETAAQAQVFGDKLSDASLKAADDARKAAAREERDMETLDGIATTNYFNMKARLAKKKADEEKAEQESFDLAMKGIEDIQKAEDKAADDHQRTALQLQKMDDDVFKHRQDAQIAALPKWEQGEAKIVASHDEAVNQLTLRYDEFVQHTKDVTTPQLLQAWHDLQENIKAEDQKEVNDLVKEHQRMVDQLAQQLDTFFNDIFGGNAAQNFLKLAEKFGEKLLASLLLGIGNGQGSTSGSSSGIFGSSILGGVLGKIFGIGGGSGSGGGGDLGNLFGLGSGDGGLSLGGDSGGISGESLGFPTGLGGTASTFGLAPLASTSVSGGTGIGGGLANVINNAPLAQILDKISPPGAFGNSAFGISGVGLAAGGAEIGLASILGAYSSGSKTLGVLGGAAGGALLGFSIGGPIGAGIGAVVGAIAGLFAGIFGGNKKKHQAQDLDNQKFFPALTALEQGYENYQVSYADEQKQMQDLENQAQQALGQYGSQGKGVYNNEFLPQAQAVQRQIDTWEKERERRSKITFAPPEFHDGGEVPAILLSGETVMNRRATARHRSTLAAMNAGASGGSGEVHIHLHALDGADLYDYLTRRGGMKQLRRALVTDAMDYAGETVA